MKKVLIYTVKNGNFVDSLYHALGRGFNELGRDVEYCYVDQPDYKSKLNALIKEGSIDFSLGHNEFGITDAERNDSLRKFYASKEHVAILDDAPYNIVTEKTFKVFCPNLLIAYRDRSHIDYLKSIILKNEVRDYFFLPFGALIDKRYDTSTEKDIDVLFSGMYYGEPERLWHNLQINKSVSLILDHAADILEANAITVEAAIMQTVNDFNLEIDKKPLHGLYRTLYQYIKPYRRNLLVNTMVNNGIEVTVCSGTWKKSSIADKLTFNHADNTQDILKLYKRSKILLSDMAEFNDGSHCRIADGALCNTLLVTESSKFLKEKFTASELVFFQWDSLKTLPKAVSLLSKNSTIRNSFADAACKKVLENFMPRHAAKIILDAVESSRKSKS